MMDKFKYMSLYITCLFWVILGHVDVRNTAESQEDENYSNLDSHVRSNVDRHGLNRAEEDEEEHIYHVLEKPTCDDRRQDNMELTVGVTDYEIPQVSMKT